jgi:ABC-type antimicrobial peptide transport system permease subunit
MFFTYLRRELRYRWRQATIIALGLALGIGLVVTVTALSRGVNRAQADVLHSLYGQDTAITVTKAPSFGSGGPGGFRFRTGGSGSRPKAGSKVSVDSLTSTALSAIPASDVASVARLNGVAAAAGGLTLNDTKLTFTIPSQSSGGGSGGFGGGGGSPGGGGGSSGGGFGSGHFPTPISVNGVDLSGNAAALGPLSAAKLVSGRTLTASDANSDVALVSSNYATAHKLKTGSVVTLAKTSFRVVGVVSAGSSNSTDVYIPLTRAQALGTAQGKSLKDKVNTIYVAAGSATDITTVSKEISANLPGATVTNQNDLAKQLTGSVSSASSLASNLGRWLAIAVLAAAFVLAVLMTTAAVSRRVREFGTLKALGWTSRRIVRQVVGESLVIGVIGGLVGIGLGFAGSALVGAFAPTLSASVGQSTGSATPGGARFFGPPGGSGGGGGLPGSRRLASAATTTVHVPLTATVTIGAVAAAVGLAIVGGLLAGAFGGWRAARLRPAAALTRVE